MENINKLISLFLGLIVIIVLFAIVTGRINLRGRFPSLGIRRTTPTPTAISTKTPTTTPKIVTITTTVQNNNQNMRPYNLTPTAKSDKTLTSIPATGSPTLLLPLIFSGISAGIYLRRKS